ncbi:MAG: hypothetical protein K0R73_31 [Candidatus Midichloriaceae bacterium]|jgi:uncharacterized protein YjbI with pentapeptide repeats|nr:hypothetical protein [Candidatus Midichloriaceae bacterium]
MATTKHIITKDNAALNLGSITPNTARDYIVYTGNGRDSWPKLDNQEYSVNQELFNEFIEKAANGVLQPSLLFEAFGAEPKLEGLISFAQGFSTIDLSGFSLKGAILSLDTEETKFILDNCDLSNANIREHTEGLFSQEDLSLINAKMGSTQFESPVSIQLVNSFTEEQRKGCELELVNAANVLDYAVTGNKEIALKVISYTPYTPNYAMLDEFFAKMEQGVLDITLLLKSLGADLVLYEKEITISKNFTEANFADISLKHADIISYYNTKLNLDGCDLSYFDLKGRHYDVGHVTLNGAKLEHAIGFITPDLYSSLSVQDMEESNFITVAKENYFYEFKLEDKYKNHGEGLHGGGICHGLAREYVRKQISWQQKGIEKNFFDTLRSKLEEISQTEESERLNHFNQDNFLQRLKEYTNITPNPASSKKQFKTTVTLSDDGKAPAPFNFFANLPKKLQEAEFLFIYLGAKHSAVLKIVKDKEKSIIGYKLYDTSYGESVLLDEAGLNKAMFAMCYMWGDLDDLDFYVSDLGKQVKKQNLIPGSEHYNKDSKNTFKLVKAIKDHDLDKIAELSKFMKIDWHGFTVKDNINWININSPLAYGITAGADEDLVALISNNNLLDFSKPKHFLCTVNKLILCDHFKAEVLHAFASNPKITWGGGIKGLLDEFLNIAENNKFKIKFGAGKKVITAHEEEKEILEKLVNNFKEHEDFQQHHCKSAANLYTQNNGELVAELFVEQVNLAI